MHRNLQFYLICSCILIASCKSPEARRPVQQSSGSFIKESAERNIEIYKKEEARIAQLIKEDFENEYIASESGFWYYYNEKDTTAAAYPRLGDVVTFTYDIKSLDGDVIISEEENGLQTYRVDQTNQELISGLRDGVKLMKEGETITFLFPSFKAFGYYGIENKLGTNIPIQSTVSLKTIEQSQEN
jgi:gliding motility-associated peptidyl-prolyl isomerase